MMETKKSILTEDTSSGLQSNVLALDILEQSQTKPEVKQDEFDFDF